MGEQTGESSMIRTYLDWLIAVPWSKRSEEHLDPIAAREVLDADHAGLEDVKDRVTEYLAVRKLRQERGIEVDPKSGAILTLIGPPGTGKTSIGESVARATGREFVRMSLGGVRDEAEIRGHRRTYIGALPGRLVRALRDAGTMNPVILLDEVDKVGADWRGDPSAALLDELDLSQVMFLATANVADTIPGPLLDRMEVIRFDGYTSEEKLAIAKGYLWPRQRDRNGLREDEVEISDEVLRTIISEYTREAGVRQLERELGTVLRKTATKIASLQSPAGGAATRDGAEAPNGASAATVTATATDGARTQDATPKASAKGSKDAKASKGTKTAKGRTAAKEPANGLDAKATASVAADKPVKIDLEIVRDALGRQKFFQESAARTATPGVATGLSVTMAGGEVLFIEASAMKNGGKGGLVLTGQLGDVMKESAQIALSYVRGHAEELGIDESAFDKKEFHVHVPAGAIPKDGPSAGVTMVTALASLLTGRPVKHTVGMTGEVTLQGRVLPIGGLKQKALAAHAAGLTDVILPERNRGDLDEIPDEVREQMTFHPVMTVQEVLDRALEPAPTVAHA
jgi:ATP-dependent Lon protease